MTKLPVAKHLNDDEYKLLLDVYQKHNRSMGLEKRNTEENCLNVYYENGDWWHYTPDRTWY